MDPVEAERKARIAAHKKEYRAKNAEKLKAQKAKYYAANKDRINEAQRRKHFDENEAKYKARCEAKGIPFVPRVYVVYAPGEPIPMGVPSAERLKAMFATREERKSAQI